MTRLVRSTAAALLLLALGGSVALAHPLGNFTINQYAGIRVEPGRVLLDVVIDAAEIPTFQLVASLDRDGDGVLTGAEADGLATDRCLAVGRDLRLSVDGTAAALSLTASGIAFPEGNGGLRTMRLACALEAPATIGDATRIGFRNDHEAARIGWHEVTAVGSGTTITRTDVPATSASARLTAYPSSLASAPDVREVTFQARAGGPELLPFSVPEATHVGPIAVEAGPPAATGGEAAGGESPRAPGAAGAGQGAGESAAAGAGAGAGESAAAGAGESAAAGAGAGPVATPEAIAAAQGGAAAAVPGGAEALPDAVRAAPVDPLVALLAFGVAILLGAGHALTPGHGKTLMAAYLVGTRGTRRHALGLGLAVSVSHTTGILVLAFVILAAERSLPPDVVVRAAPIVAAVSFVVVGAWMLATELRRRLATASLERAHAHEHEAVPAHEHEHDHAHGPDAGHERGHEHEPGARHGHEAGHEHDHARPHGSSLRPSHEHSHGSVRHSHLPAGGTVTWRGLFLLGLAGGLVPSANALLILLGTVAAGRPAWGVVLVIAFGLGMAAVMGGIGLALVMGRERIERSAWRPRVPRVAGLVPLGAAVAVLAIGLVLTTQALAAARLG